MIVLVKEGLTVQIYTAPHQFYGARPTGVRAGITPAHLGLDLIARNGLVGFGEVNSPVKFFRSASWDLLGLPGSK